jgi:ABC-type dipeptide/oligopeptide/nickel transport system permease component
LGLARFIGYRVLASIPVLIGVTFLTFIVARVITPNPARAWAGLITDRVVIQHLVEQYHLNDPFYSQYAWYMLGILQGNWGISPLTKLPVLYEIENYFPATLELVLVATIISLIFGTLFGVFAAMKHDTRVDHVLRLSYLSGVATPPFLGALIASIIFTHFIPLLPSGGQLSPGVSLPRITGMDLIDSLLDGRPDIFVDALYHVILPASVLAFLGFGIGARVLRASMLEALGQDYVRTARAKGLDESTVIWKHVLRNSLTAATTVFALSFSALLGGTLVIEYIFSWPGIGSFAVNSILNDDFPSVVGVTLIYAIGVVVANLYADIMYGIIDPRAKA